MGGLLGIQTHGHAMPELVTSIVEHLGQINLYTLAVGMASLAVLAWVRLDMKKRLSSWGVPSGIATFLVRAAPAVVVLAAIAASALFDLGGKGVALVGHVPQGIPLLSIPNVSLDLITVLIGPAFIISIVGFVESISVAQTLAAKKRERIDPDQELVGLGAANIFSGLGSRLSRHRGICTIGRQS